MPILKAPLSILVLQPLHVARLLFAYSTVPADDPRENGDQQGPHELCDALMIRVRMGVRACVVDEQSHRDMWRSSMASRVRFFCRDLRGGKRAHFAPRRIPYWISGELDGRSPPALDRQCAPQHTALLRDGRRRCGAPCAAAPPAPAPPRTRALPARLVRGDVEARVRGCRARGLGLGVRGSRLGLGLRLP